MKPVTRLLWMFPFLFLCCADQGEEPGAPQGSITSDASLFELITRRDPFTAYTMFPLADSITSGTLNGSNAHQPLVTVRLNQTALSSLQSGRLPAGSAFADGSIIVKQIIVGGQTAVIAVLYKDTGNPLAGEGWLWSEFQPDGTPLFSITTRGANCTGCHMREEGPQHDLVRTFERQR